MYLPTEHLHYPSLSHPFSAPKVDLLLEKGSGEVNEDVLLQEGNLYGVFDGATSLDGRRFEVGQTGGLLAAKIAAETFAANDYSLEKLAYRANEKIAKMQMAAVGALPERQRLWSTSCAVVRLTGNQLEYCQTGDALIVLLLQDGSYKIITPGIDVDGETLHLWKELQVAPGAKIQEVLAEQIVKVRLEMNVRYGVLNGESEALKFISHGFEELTEVSDILLFTDGLHLPQENPLKEHDWQTFVEIYRQGGLQAVRARVRDLQKQDTDCRLYPRFKIHDDIAAISLSC